ncbi:MAG: ketosteroid isomerase [Microbacteriaceae bacterium]|nr:ketosteroid isomerase [Microbacteriaceae bacterium]
MTELAAPIQRMIEATNRGDSPGFLATFADNVYLKVWSREFHGLLGVARWNQSDLIGKDARLEVLSHRDEGTDQVVTLKVTRSSINGIRNVVFTVAGDKISRVIIDS